MESEEQNKQTKQKQAHRHREQTEGLRVVRWEGVGGLGERIKKYKLVVRR